MHPAFDDSQTVQTPLSAEVPLTGRLILRNLFDMLAKVEISHEGFPTSIEVQPGLNGRCAEM